MSTDRERILAHLKASGPCKSADVAAALGLQPRSTTKALSEMRRLGTAIRCEGTPVRFAYGREPVSESERLRRAREAYSVTRPRRDPNRIREHNREYRKAYDAANRESVAKKRRERYERAKAARPPRVVKPKVTPKASRQRESMVAAAVAQKGAPRVELAVKPVLQTSEDFIRAGGVIEVLPVGATSQPIDRLTPAQRHSILTLQVAA